MTTDGTANRTSHGTSRVNAGSGDTIPAAVEALYRDAARLHESGALDGAVAAYRQLLELAPNHADAWSNLGVALAAGNDLIGSVAALERAVAADPSKPGAHNNLGIALGKIGEIARALECFRRALTIDPASSQSLNNLGNLLEASGEIETAVKCYQRAMAVDPSDSSSLNSLGNILYARGDSELALRCYRRAVERRPNDAESHYNLGNVLHHLGKSGAAIEAYTRALELAPLLADAHNNLGIACAKLGDYAAAIASYRRALAIAPDHARARNNLGNALGELYDSEAAIECYRHALALDPDYIDAQNNLGVALARRGVARSNTDDIQDAIAAFRRILVANPRHADAWNNLASLLKETGDVIGSMETYRRALEIDPARSDTRLHLIHAERRLAGWKQHDEVDTLVTDALKGTGDAVSPFPFLALPELDSATHRGLSRHYANRACGAVLREPPLYRSRWDARTLRIGYLSADLRRHPVAQLLVEVLERRDRSDCELYGYTWGPDDGEPITRRIRATFDRLRDLNGLSDEAAARIIAADGVDILVDLMGYTQHCRTRILAYRPAPVQVNWLGYPASLGHERLADYLIGDAIATPLEHAACYSEHLALMPHCFQPNDRQCAIDPPPPRAQAGLPDDAVVLASFNQPYKLTPALFDAWCRVLACVPHTLLWLVDGPEPMRLNLRREAAARGIDPERLHFAPKLPLAAHLGRLQCADLALDTFPYGSGTTGANALWAGVPLVALEGEHLVSRMSASLLHAAGLPELVTTSLADYERLIVALARAPDRRLALRQRLAHNRLHCPLFDSARFARDLQALFQRMWTNHLEGHHHPLAPEEKGSPSTGWRRSKRDSATA